MVANVYPSRQAERVIFSELFRNPADVARNGGTLVGAPVIKNGAVLGGVADSVTHAIGATDLSVREISFECRFIPDSAYTEDANRYLYDTSSGSRYLALKLNNAGSNALQINLGNTVITQIASAVYGAYWLAGKENILIVSSDGATTNAWLNGTQIATAVAVAWTVAYPSLVSIGANFGAGSPFAGTIRSLTIRATLMTQADVDAIQTARLWTYPNRASVWLDMAEATERGGLKQTLDKSPNGHVCLLGDGSTAASIPSFENPGFGCDGVDNHMELPDASFLYEDEITLGFAIRPNYGPGSSGAHVFLFDDGLGTLKYSVFKASGGGLALYLGGALSTVSEAALTPYWVVDGLNVLLVAINGTDRVVMLNGHIVAETVTAYAKSAVPSAKLWERNNGSANHDGGADGFCFWPEKLSPLQMIDATISRGVNV